ncbi:hypothetical protein [Desulfovibrio inopinatus]|uniref:hypothetical protein n=1 Tax=Desulfovibrio inopinatus TaxID=102109 RepID=UPI000429E6C4|nr:hypothetical protein [Desulfovibrio inopinatus]
MATSRFVVSVVFTSAKPMAISVLEIDVTRLWPMPGSSTAYQLRYLEQIPQGTPYRDVVSKAKSMMGSPHLRKPGYGRPLLIVDFSEVGRPMLETVRRERLDPVALYIGGDGGQVTRPVGARPDPKEIIVPWPDIMLSIQLCYQEERIQVASGLAAVEVYNIALASCRADMPGGITAYHDGELLRAVGAGLWVCERGRDYAVGLEQATARPVTPVYPRKGETNELS